MCGKCKNDDILKDIQSKIEVEHFKIHSFSKVKINVLDTECNNDKRLESENRYIIKFRTLYPYGLNDRVNNCSISSVKDNLCIYQNYLQCYTSDNTSKTNRVRSKSKNVGKYIDFRIFIEDIAKVCFNKSRLIKFIKGKIMGLKIRQAKVLFKLIDDFKFPNFHIKDLIIDLLKFKTKSNKSHVAAINFDSYLSIKFSHKFIDLLNIPRILQDNSVKHAFPVNDTYPKCSFKYSRTLGSIVYNYSSFGRNIDVSKIDEYP